MKQPTPQSHEASTGEAQGGATDLTGDEAVADAFERLIWEAYKLLGEGEMEKAELLLMEGEHSESGQNQIQPSSSPCTDANMVS